jgi:hypothetical protein
VDGCRRPPKGITLSLCRPESLVKGAGLSVSTLKLLDYVLCYVL